MRFPNCSSPRIELLESRIAPATITPTLVTYTDLDGDLVKVACSLPVLGAPGALVFASSDGGVHEVLQMIHLDATANLAKLAITATTLPGGSGDGFVNVGAIDATGVNLGPVTVDGDLGQIDAGHNDALVRAVASLAVHSLGRFGPSTQGASPGFKSSIAGSIGSVRVATDLVAASILVSGSMTSLTVGGSLIGGSGDDTGEVSAGGSIGFVKVGDSVVGGDGANSGRISSGDRVPAYVSIGGSVLGGAGVHSGEISTGRKIDALTIGGDLRGGTNKFSGRITSGTSIGLLTIGGSVIGASHDNTGEINVAKNIDALTIRGDLRGGSADGSASVDKAGFITSDHIGTLFIRGSVLAGVNDSTGTLTNSGSIATSDEIISVRINGSLVGSVSTVTGKTTAARLSGEDNALHNANPTSDLAIRSIFIGGRVESAIIEAGYSSDGLPVDGDAKIGTLTIRGDLISSNIIAGIQSSNATFGDADFSDTPIVNDGAHNFPTNYSRIGSIVIGGQVLGSLTAGDAFGIEAQQIGAVKIGGVSLRLTSAVDDFIIAAATGGDVRVREFPIF